MALRLLISALFVGLLGVGARAQTANQVITGYLSTSGCPSVATTPCFVQYGPGGASTVTIGAPLGSQSAANSVAVVCNSGCSGGPADESTFTAGTTSITTGGFFQTSATSNPLTNGQAGSVQLTANRAFMVNLRTSAGVETGIAAAPLQVSLANTASNATAVLVTGTGGAFPVSGAISNASSAVATSSTNIGSVAYNYGFNGTTWDQLQVDGSKNLKTTTIGTGTAGSAATGVLTVQGIASMTPLLTNPGTAANWGVGAVASTPPANGLYNTGDALSAEPTKATTGNLIGSFYDLTGKAVTSPYANRESMVRGSASSTGTGATTLIAAGGASVKTYITDVECGRSDAGTTAITVTLSDAAATVLVLPNSGGGGGNNKTFNVPLVTAANTAFTFTPGTSTTTVFCSAQGFSGY